MWRSWKVKSAACYYHDTTDYKFVQISNFRVISITSWIAPT